MEQYSTDRIKGSIVTNVITRIRNNLSGNLALINIFQGTSQPQLEKAILKKGASYGRQLGVLLDMVEYLKEHTETLDNNARQVKAFDDLINEIKGVKLNYRGVANREQLTTQLDYIAAYQPELLRYLKNYIDQLSTQTQPPPTPGG